MSRSWLGGEKAKGELKGSSVGELGPATLTSLDDLLNRGLSVFLAAEMYPEKPYLSWGRREGREESFRNLIVENEKARKQRPRPSDL